MLLLNDVTAGYIKHAPVLKHVGFHLNKGELAVLLGKNGSGKSTLFACVNREIRYKGCILVDGTDIHAISPRAAAQKIAILPQMLRKIHLTVEELVLLGRSPYINFAARPGKNDFDAVQEAMLSVGIQSLAEAYVDRISGGERQKAYLAMVLAQQTPLILLDEPTTYMDASCKAEFMHLLAQICRKEGKTLLIVTHDLELAVTYADRVLLLDAGELVFDGDADTCIAEGAIEKIFGVKQHVLYEENRRYVFYTDRRE